ncbi:MAG: hypothetical protein RMK84_20000 [Oscillochloridaceae bacterium]|nr:hypothetical protein [Oscillochloridaceae bacterium]
MKMLSIFINRDQLVLDLLLPANQRLSKSIFHQQLVHMTEKTSSAPLGRRRQRGARRHRQQRVRRVRQRCPAVILSTDYLETNQHACA